MSTELTDPHKKLNVFISYAREQRALADAIVAALEEHGLSPTIDTRNLPKLEDWRRELIGFIREADAVIFLLSDASLTSPVCAWELEQATALNKRLAPILVERIEDERLPAALAKINYLDITEPTLFEQQAAALANALVTDLEWVKDHTRLGEAARRWDENQRPKFRLLHGDDIDAAERWAARRPASAPRLTETTQKFIEESRIDSKLQIRRARLRNRIITAVSLAVAFVMAALGWFYYQQWQEGQKALARARYMQGQWTARAEQPDQAAAYFADAVRIDPDNAKARVALYNQLSHVWHLYPRARIEAGKPVRGVSYSKDGSLLLVSTASEVRLYRADDASAPRLTLRHDESIQHAAINDANTQILTTATTFGSIAEAPYGVIRLWDAATGRLIASRTIEGRMTTAAYAPNGEILAANAFRPIVLSATLDRETADLRSSLVSGKHRTRNVPTIMRLSSDGKLLLWGSGAAGDSVFYVWNLENRQLLYKRTPSLPFNELRFVLGNRKIAFGGPDPELLGGIGSQRFGFVAAQGPDDDAADQLSVSRDSLLSTMDVDPSGTFVFSAFENKTARLVNAFNERATDHHHDAVITTSKFSPDGLMLAAGDNEGRVRIFDALGLRAPSAAHRQGGRISSIAFSRTAPRMATASSDGSIVIWDTATTMAKELVLETGRPRMRDAIPIDGASPQLLIRSDGRVELWDAAAGRQFSELTIDTDRLQFSAIAPKTGLALLTGEARTVLLKYNDEKIVEVPQSLPAKIIMSAFNEAGDRLVAVAKDKVQVIDSMTGAVLLDIAKQQPNDDLAAARFLENGSLLLVASQAKLAIWDVRNKRMLKYREHGAMKSESRFDNGKIVTDDAPLRIIDTIIHESNGRMLVVFGYEGANVLAPPYRPGQVLVDAQIWSLPALEPINGLIGGTDQINSVALSPSGHVIVAASQSAVRFVAANDGAPVRSPVDADFSVFRAALSRDETFAAFYGQSNDVLLVDIRDKESPPRRLVHGGRVTFATFLESGSVLLTASADGRARLWDVAESAVIGAELIVGSAEDVKLAANEELLVTRMKPGVVTIRRLRLPHLSNERLTLFAEIGEDIAGQKVAASGNTTAAPTSRTDVMARLAHDSSNVLTWFMQEPANRAVFPGATLQRSEVVRRYVTAPIDDLAVLITLLHQSPNDADLLAKMAQSTARYDPNENALAGLGVLWKDNAEFLRLQRKQ